MKSKASKIISKIVMAVIGVVLIAFPGTALVSLIRFIGIAILLIGLFGIINFIVSPVKGVITSLLFGGAVILALLSLLPIIKPELIIAIFPIAVGIVILVNGIGNVFEAISMKAMLKGWFVPLILSLLTVVAGCLIIANPFATTDMLVRVVGIILVYNAVVGLYLAVTYKAPREVNGVIDITDMNQ